MGWHSTGKFGVHSGRTLRRYPARKGVSVHDDLKVCGLPKRRHEFAVIKELKSVNGAPIVDSNAIGFSFDDGGLCVEKDPWYVSQMSSPIYSLNKRKRWLLPDLMKEKVEEVFYEENNENAPDSKSKIKKKQCKKGSKLKKTRVDVVERHSVPEGLKYGYMYYTTAKAVTTTPDCIGVTSTSPLNSSNPHRTPSQKHSHVADLRRNRCKNDEGLELTYEFVSPYPKGAWPANRQIRNYRVDQEDEINLEGTGSSKKTKKVKGRKHKDYHLHGGKSWDESAVLWLDGSDACCFDDYADDVVLENCPERTYSESTFPIGAFISNAIEMQRNKNTDKLSAQSGDDAPSVSTPTVYGKGQAIIIANDDKMFKPGPSDLVMSTVHSRETMESKSSIEEQRIRIDLVADSIKSENLLKEFGSNYIEGDVSPRKFIIKLDFTKTLPKDADDDVCLLFDVLDTHSGEETVQAFVALSSSENVEMLRGLNTVLGSDLGSLKNSGPLTVSTIVDSLMARIATETASKSIAPKKKSKTNIPVEFIHEICKQEPPKVCSLREAVCYAVKNEEKTGSLSLVLPKEENAILHNESFCEICYVEEDVIEPASDRTSFTRLLRCSHQFCNGCWTQYIETCINDRHVSITCPRFECKTSIAEPLVWSCTNSEFYQKYRKLRMENLINSNARLRHCPSSECRQLAWVEQPESIPVLCECGLLWCFRCQNEAHWPASCNEMDEFSKECKNRQEYMRMLRSAGTISSVLVKRCPMCGHPIEKSYGCPHMYCRCGKEFCWDCLSPWEEHDWESCDANAAKELEEVELTVGQGSARCEKYYKIAFRNAFERTGKNFLVFQHLSEKAKKIENAHELITSNPKAAACRFVRTYNDKGLASMLEKLFRFKILGHFVLENTAAYVAIAKTAKLTTALDRKMDSLRFIIQRFSDTLREPLLIHEEGRLQVIQHLLNRGEKLVVDINKLVKANRKD